MACAGPLRRDCAWAIVESSGFRLLDGLWVWDGSGYILGHGFLKTMELQLWDM